MRYATFIGVVEQAAGISRAAAERAVHATLATLAERVTGGEARDIALFLPEEVRRPLESAPERAEAFALEEFVRRVAERERVAPEAAAEHARAVFEALGLAVAPGELRDMLAQLPSDFAPLLKAAGLGRRRLSSDEPDLVGRVAGPAGLDRTRARRATETVLETLATRISAGEVEDLIPELPPDLVPALERGLAESRAAKLMTSDEFIATVADREGVDIDEAERHARAVFAALREVVSGKEFSDMVAQLSEDYLPLLA
ncbi:MAG: hypothetical protein QOD81_3698 [Solirubrobacteraceae bacterium]|jgi:uncharacterized protein (DUF2267 family)|nr:hypothetical protein [Solirubrobacteraceae bacterium]